MKKINIILALLTISLMLAACGKNGVEAVNINSYSNKNGFLNFSSDVAESPEGYYVLSKDLRNGNFLTYIDKEKDKSTILCSKINCAHTFEKVPDDCDAYLGTVLQGSLNYYNGYIYYIAYNKDNYKCSLYKVSFDGSEHEKIFDLGTAPDMSNIYYSYVVTDSCVFYSAAIGVSGEKNAAKLNRYIFDNSKIETVYNYEGDKAEIFDLKMCNDKVFFRQSVGNERLKSELYEWDIAGQRANKIAEGICSYTLKADEKLAYWKAFDGIYEIPMTTGNTAENIVENEEKIFTCDEDTMLGFIASSNSDYYLYNMINTSYKKDTDIYIGNIKEGRIITKLYVNKEDYMMPLYVGSDKLIVDVYGKDGRYCGYSEIDNGQLSDEIINMGIIR